MRALRAGDAAQMRAAACCRYEVHAGALRGSCRLMPDAHAPAPELFAGAALPGAMRARLSGDAAQRDAAALC